MKMIVTNEERKGAADIFTQVYNVEVPSSCLLDQFDRFISKTRNRIFKTQIDPQSKKFWNEFVEFESDEIILLGRAHTLPGRGNVPPRALMVAEKREGTFPSRTTPSSSRPRNVETLMEQREQSGSKKGSFGSKKGSFGSDRKGHSEEMRTFSRSFKKKRKNLGLSHEQVGRDVGVITGKSYTHKSISHFEALTVKNETALEMKPFLERWINRQQASAEKEPAEKEQDGQGSAEREVASSGSKSAVGRAAGSASSSVPLLIPSRNVINRPSSGESTPKRSSKQRRIQERIKSIEKQKKNLSMFSR